MMVLLAASVKSVFSSLCPFFEMCSPPLTDMPDSLDSGHMQQNLAYCLAVWNFVKLQVAIIVLIALTRPIPGIVVIKL